MQQQKPKKRTYECAACGRTLKDGKWVIGKNRQLADGKIPRYCLPGSGGCNK